MYTIPAQKTQMLNNVYIQRVENGKWVHYDHLILEGLIAFSEEYGEYEIDYACDAYDLRFEPEEHMLPINNGIYGYAEKLSELPN